MADDRLRRLSRLLDSPVERGGASTAVAAAARRLDPLAPGKHALPVLGLLAQAGVALDAPREIACWSVLANMLALARGMDDERVPIGKALFELGFGEGRLGQLLSSDFAGLTDLLPRLARRLAANSQRADFRPLARLLFAAYDNRNPELEHARLAIAESFVRAQQRKDTNKEQGTVR